MTKDDGNTLLVFCAKDIISTVVNLRTTPASIISEANLGGINFINVVAKIFRAKTGPENYSIATVLYDIQTLSYYLRVVDINTNQQLYTLQIQQASTSTLERYHYIANHPLSSRINLQKSNFLGEGLTSTNQFDEYFFHSGYVTQTVSNSITYDYF